MFFLTVEESFSAAHQLRGYEGPCEALHGHTWRVLADVAGKKTDRLGILIDFKVLKNKLFKVLKDLDHKNLNDLKPFRKINPTSENVAKYVFLKLKGEFGGGAKLSGVTVFESPTSSARYHE